MSLGEGQKSRPALAGALGWPAVVIKLVRRVVEGAVTLLALYAFATVPLGKQTGLEHLRAILSTDEAKEAGRELKQAGSRILSELLEYEGGEIRGLPNIPTELLGAPPQSLVTPRDASPEDEPGVEPESESR